MMHSFADRERRLSSQSRHTALQESAESPENLKDTLVAQVHRHKALNNERAITDESNGGYPSANRPGECNRRGGSVQSSPSQTRDANMTYWSALNLVCCPCLPSRPRQSHSRRNERESVPQQFPKQSTPIVSQAPGPSVDRVSECMQSAEGERSARLELERPIYLGEEKSYERELDRLLLEWTTIYDVPSTIIENMTVDGQ